MKSVRSAISDRVSLYSAGPGFAGSGVKPLRKRFDPSQPIAEAENDTNSILPCEPLEIVDGELVDPSGRKRTLKGINVDASMKLPAKPFIPLYEGDSGDPNSVFFDGENVSFVGRPFPLEEAEAHLNRIKLWGFNTIRYLLTWEAIEHAGPGKYDTEFIQYTIDMLRIIHKVGGIYVFLEPHQDVWLRYSGGSGAPLWTLYAAGLQPTRFNATEAAVLQNNPKYDRAWDHECYPKMLWTTNYNRLALTVMFTYFFAGNTYFPHLKINGQNIQHFLQKYHLRALKYLWKAVVNLCPDLIDDGTILGFESMNEPNMGLVGHEHLGQLPAKQHLRLDTTPTKYQCFRLGMGLPCELAVYKITVSGPQQCGTRIVDPKGERAWLLPDEAAEIDAKYGWKRTGFRIGECPFAQLKIWRWNKNIDWEKLKTMTQEERIHLSRYECELLSPNYFNQVLPRLNFQVVDDKLPERIDLHFFINNLFVEYFIKFKQFVRTILPLLFVLMQPPVLEIPPALKNDSRGIVDDKILYCPHYYDGISLLFKTWNERYNVDTLGIMRGRYFNPVLGLVVGERAIRNCIKKQFCEIKAECKEYLGNIPVLMSETGMPFDMNNKRAYEDRRYTLQTKAVDALANAQEGAGMHITWWCYSSLNCHKWGDRWNNEDFSFWLPEDRDLAFDDDDAETAVSLASKKTEITPLVKAIRSMRESAGRLSYLRTKLNYHTKRFVPQLFKKSVFYDEDDDFLDDGFEGSVENLTLISVSADNLRYKHLKNCYPSPDGVRAASAVFRPSLLATTGTTKATEFDMKSLRFALTLTINEQLDEKTLEKCPTVIYVPKWHYPYLNYSDIYLTSGHVKYNERLEYLEWYHYDSDDAATTTSSSMTRPSNEETIIIKNNSGRYEDINSNDDNCSIV